MDDRKDVLYFIGLERLNTLRAVYNICMTPKSKVNGSGEPWNMIRNNLFLFLFNTTWMQHKCLISQCLQKRKIICVLASWFSSSPQWNGLFLIHIFTLFIYVTIYLFVWWFILQCLIYICNIEHIGGPYKAKPKGVFMYIRTNRIFIHLYLSKRELK